MAAPIRVMIVETDARMREGLAKILKASPHAMAAEVTGPDGAVTLYSKTQPDVVITRLVFPPVEGEPRMGGIELIKMLKTIDENAKVIVSFDGKTSYLVMSAIRAGAAARIGRPYKYQTVMRAINDVVSPESSGTTLVRLQKPLQVKYRPARWWVGRSQRQASSSAIAFKKILLNTEEKLSEGAELKLKIALPRLKKPLRGRGKVVKVKTIVPGHSYEIDCSLRGLSDEAKRKLDVFLVWGGDVGAGAG